MNKTVKVLIDQYEETIEEFGKAAQSHQFHASHKSVFTPLAKKPPAKKENSTAPIEPVPRQDKKSHHP